MQMIEQKIFNHYICLVENEKIILGIDPGTTIMGYGFFEVFLLFSFVRKSFTENIDFG